MNLCQATSAWFCLNWLEKPILRYWFRVLFRGDSDAYEFRVLHVIVSNIYHAETVCKELKGMWQAVFSNDVAQSLRVILAFARKLC